MKKIRTNTHIIFLLGLTLLATSLTLTAPETDQHKDPARALSAELQQLLVKEMQLIDDGVGQLQSAISSGDWHSVEAIASKIQHSFILKQQLTDPQRHELHSILPGEFVRMDIQFHETAGKLAAVSHERDVELATFYYSRLIDGCVNCHASFAPQRFPGLAVITAPESHQDKHPRPTHREHS